MATLMQIHVITVGSKANGWAGCRFQAGHMCILTMFMFLLCYAID